MKHIMDLIFLALIYLSQLNYVTLI